jgi:hypothetical protein
MSFNFFINYRRKNSLGELIDANSPQSKLQGPFDNEIAEENDAVVLKVWPEVIENGGKVTVLWSNMKKPLHTDIIAYYCPFIDKATHAVDYMPVTGSSTWQEGYGHFFLTLYNMRTECGFRYYSSKKLIAMSNKVTFYNGGPFDPLHIHLAMTNDPTEMRVMWNSAQGKYYKCRNILQDNNSLNANPFSDDL